ncbi:putative transmembrane protein [Escherichia coli]|nr:putative transmembrane protein [Escherichia coli]
MAVNSNGSNNRVAGRDFHEKNIQIERYDGSHTVNIAIPSNNDDDDRPLLKAQRKELNSLVAAIAEASNTEAFIIWQKVHAEGNDSNLLIVFYVQIMPDDFVMQLHRF